MHWKSLLSEDRYPGVSANPVEPDRDPFEVDIDRVAFCDALRRLGDKTQVHGRLGTDHVRNRLTHSFEVSRIARSLGHKATRCVNGMAQEGLLDPEKVSRIAQVGGLAHDIGSLPFGHLGERDISDWFRKNGHELAFDPEYQRELEAYEGNAQGFRILARLEGWYTEGGLQLTAASLASMQKYPRKSALEDLPVGTKWQKYGVFRSEWEAWLWVAERCGLRVLENGETERHPLSYITEAADDIAYTVADVEDGVRTDCLTEDEAIDLLRTLAPDATEYENARVLPRLRSAAIGCLIDACAAAFAKNMEHCSTSEPGSLVGLTPYADAMQYVLAVSKERIYKDPQLQINREACRAAINTILDVWVNAFMEREIRGEIVPRKGASLLYAFPKIEQVPLSRDGWLRSLTDYVAGMTDGHAMRLARQMRPSLDFEDVMTIDTPALGR